MEANVFEALDRAIEAGGENLSAKSIAGNRKSATALLQALCLAGYLQATGKPVKYTVTEKGRQAWAEAVPEERRREVEQRPLLAFLRLVELKPGSSLSAKDLAGIPMAIRQRACAEKLVEAGEKANSYDLTPAGESLLLAELPFDEQLEKLRQLSRRTITQWRATHQRLAREVDALGVGLQEAATQLAERGEAARRAFDAVVAELGPFTHLVEAARKLRAESEAHDREMQNKLDAEKARLLAMKEDLNAELRKEAERVATIEQRMESRLTNGHNGNGAATPPEATVWEATRAAYAKMRQATLSIGGIVKVPELTDAVLRSVPGVSVETFHSLLQRWQGEDRLTLQLCDDPRLEPRAAEGIRSPRGLLFYVRLR